jgi:IS4 transposase
MLQLGKIFSRFLNKSPVSVMVRALLEHALAPPALDALFARVAKVQYTRELLFSSLIDLMSLVVCKVQPSIHAAYQAQDDIPVSVASVYNKLNGLETAVSEALVGYSCGRLLPVLAALDAPLPDPLPGYPLRILDGNHLPATQHRIAELRTMRAGALPGHSLVVYDPQQGLVRSVFCCEDGHAQERSLLPRVLLDVRTGEVWVADRNFCTTDFLFGIARRRKAFFVIRQHGSTLRGKRLLGKRRYRGKTKSGEVYEQRMELDSEDGSPPLVVRRITICLFEPTRDGDREIHILTNLPRGGKRGVSAVQVAEVYSGRWRIETAFQEVEAFLASELNTLGYPKAGLFGFCVALVAYNVLAVVRASLRCVHGVDLISEQVSGYYLANEVRRVYEGMMIAIEAGHWEQFANCTAEELAACLRQLAAQVRLAAFQKHPRGPKKPKPKKASGYKLKHVATAKVLAERKNRPKSRSGNSP